jgi:LCP family protein required for cell wall assembly
MPSSGNKPDPDRPDYNVYRSRRGLFSRFRKPDLGSLSGKEKQAADRQRAARSDRQDLPYEVHRSGSGRGGDRYGSPGSSRPSFGRKGGRSGRGGKRWLKWILLAMFGWLVLSFLAFGISAQIQSMKLSGDAKDALGGSPWILTNPQNILIIGTDSRPPDTLEPGAAQEERCYEQQAEGEAPHDGCAGARADTLMVVRAGGGKFKKLSIPRDSYAAIPGQDSQKINGAYAFGGAALQIQTVEDFLGITIDHVVILNFTGFEDFIDAIGGVKVDVPEALCSEVSGGKEEGGVTIRLQKGENTLNGTDALAFARTRADKDPTDNCSLPEGYDDLDRAAAQQLVMNGIKERLTDPLRLPYNFIKGPIIGWTAPKAFVSDMGFVTLPQLALSTVFAGSSKPDVLIPSGNGPGGSLEIPESERQRAAAELES